MQSIPYLFPYWFYLFPLFSSAFAYYPSGEILHYYCCKNLTSPPSSEHTTPRHSPTPEDNLPQRYWPEVTHHNSHAGDMLRWILPDVMSCAIYWRCTCRAHIAWWVVKSHVCTFVTPRAFQMLFYPVILFPKSTIMIFLWLYGIEDSQDPW